MVDESSDVMARYTSDGLERTVKTLWSLTAEVKEALKHANGEEERTTKESEFR